MTALVWTLIGLGYCAVAFFAAIGLGRVFRINVEAPRQRARRVMRRQTQLDVEYAVNAALQQRRI